MRKSLYLASGLMAAAVLSLPFALAWVNGQKEKILITEEVLYGDPAEAAGITLDIPVHWGKQLLWDTEYAIGSGKEAESEFTFSGHGVFWEREEEVDAGILIAGGWGATFSEHYTYLDWDQETYGGMVQSVEAGTPNGEANTEILRISDYEPVYPLTFQILGHSAMFQGDYRQACRYLAEYFHVSPAGDKMEVTVGKNEEGQVVSVNCNTVESDDAVSLVSAAADGGKGIYYAYGLQNLKTGEYADRGHNRGIFYFPYEEGGNGIWQVDLTQVRKVSDFPEDGFPLQMLADREKGMLYLAVREQEGYSLFLYRLEGETPVLAQQIPVDRNNLSGNMACLEELEEKRRKDEAGRVIYSDGGGEGNTGWAKMQVTGGEPVSVPAFCQMSLEEGGILMTWSDNSFSFVAEEEGQYRWWCDGVFPDAEETGYDADNSFMRESSFPWESVCVFDGERLILAAYEGWYNLNVILTVYDEKGRTYIGRYRHSLAGEWEAGYGAYYGSRDSFAPQGNRRRMPHGWYWDAGNEIRSEEPLKMRKDHEG